MANGPKCSDVAQEYILNVLRKQSSDKAGESSISFGSNSSGDEEWTIGDVFDGGNLEDLECESEVSDGGMERLEENFRNLDAVYDALKTTREAGRGPSYRKIEGLSWLEDDKEKRPVENDRTWYNWLNDYERAGLIEREEGENQLTEIGEMILESTRNMDSGLDVDPGEIYRNLVTHGYGGSEANTGEKIQAFFLYPGSLTHKEVEEVTGLSERTAGDFAESMRNLGLYSSENYFTETGRKAANVIERQLSEV